MNPDDVLARHTKYDNDDPPSCIECGSEWREDGCDAVVMAREVKRLEEIAQFLFARLDDVDTCFDQYKPEATTFTRAVDRLHKRRFEVGKTDGYTVTWRAALAAEGEKA